MKVLISRKDLKDTTSGVPKKVLQEIRFFRERGFEAYAIAETMNYSMIREFQGIPIKTLRWPVSGYFRRKFYQLNVDRWIKKNKPDLVIGHGDIRNQDVLFIHNCVHLAHELIEGKTLPLDHEVGRIHEEILKEGNYKLLICNSQLMKDDLVKRFHLDEKKAVVIYPEVNLEKFKAEDPEAVKLEWREKLGFASDDFVIGLVTSGNFKKRNLALLIESFKEVNEKFPKAKLFIAGGGIDQQYKDLVEKLGLTSLVTFAPAIIDVKNYLYLLDVFVLPALIEEFGRSVLEAMYCGKSVITTSKVGCSEIMEGKSREFILDSIEKAALVRMLERLLNDSELREELGKRNSQTAIKYSASTQNERFGEVLQAFNLCPKGT